MTADRTGLAQAGTSALLIRGAVLVVGLFVRPSAGRGGTAGVQDPGEVPELDPGIMPLGLKLVVARSGEVFQLEHQLPGGAGVPGVPGGAGCGGAGEVGDVEPDGVRSGRVGSAAGCGPVAGGAG